MSEQQAWQVSRPIICAFFAARCQHIALISEYYWRRRAGEIRLSLSWKRIWRLNSLLAL